MIRPVKQEKMEQEVQFHFGVFKRDFYRGELDQDLVENLDEIHFVVNMENGLSVSFVGKKEVKYADVSSGGVGMTMMVRITGGKMRVSSHSSFIFRTRLRTIQSEGYLLMYQAYQTGQDPKGG